MDLSIIIPTFNAERTLSKCLQSIDKEISESFKFEVIIIDGGSSDSTIKIAKNYITKLPLKIYSERDNGVYDAMNKAIRRARGQWIYFIGADDTLLPDFINALKLLDQSIDLLYGNVYFKNSNRKYDGEFSLSKLAEKNICHQAIFYRREVLLQFGGFNLKYPILADYELNLRLFANNKVSVKYIDLTIAEFSESGLSSKSTDLQFFYDKPAIIQNIFENYLALPAYHHALFIKGELEFKNWKILKGISTIISWGRVTNRPFRSVYLILAMFKNRLLCI